MKAENLGHKPSDTRLAEGLSGVQEVLDTNLWTRPSATNGIRDQPGPRDTLLQLGNGGGVGVGGQQEA